MYIYYDMLWYIFFSFKFECLPVTLTHQRSICIEFRFSDISPWASTERHYLTCQLFVKNKITNKVTTLSGMRFELHRTLPTMNLSKKGNNYDRTSCK